MTTHKSSIYIKYLLMIYLFTRPLLMAQITTDYAWEQAVIQTKPINSASSLHPENMNHLKNTVPMADPKAQSDGSF
jgi:hypothetical protein